MTLDPLHSWNDGSVKSAILDFVARVTKGGGPDYVPPAERIATFDNDGTLWCEQPLVQVFFLIDRVKERVARDPAIKERQPFKALLERDLKTLHAHGKQGIMELVAATHAGMTEEDFDSIALAWLAKAKHPKFDRLFTHCTYQPLAYAVKEIFKTLQGEGGQAGRAAGWSAKSQPPSAPSTMAANSSPTRM